MSRCPSTGLWAGLPQWRVLDTHWGDGLQFLTHWAAWRADPARARLLHWVALLPQTPPAPTPANTLDHPSWAGLAHELASQWHGLLPGFHRLAFDGGRVLLTLCIGEQRAMLRAQHFEADGILTAADGTPSEQFKAVARFARRGTLLWASGPTAPSAQVLAQAGFQAAAPDPDEATNAAAPLAHALFDPPWQLRRRTPIAAPLQPGHCAVVGAGLAGAAVAASLARRGWRVTVFDAEGAASGASALPVGLLAPHVSPDDALLSRLTRAGIRVTWQQLEQHLIEGTDWRASGVLERRDLTAGEAPDTRLPPDWRATGPNESWRASTAQLQAAGLPPDVQALWHARAGWVRPARLVAAWLAQPGITVRAPSRVASIAREGTDWALRDAAGQGLAQVDRVVIAAGLASAAFVDGLPLQPVRGQVMWGHAEGLPATPLNGDGHLIAGVPDAGGPLWLAGATYDRDDTDTAPRDADTQANQARLARLHPGAAAALAGALAQGQVQAWAGVRCASADRRPLVGPVRPHGQPQGEPDPTLWLCAALGSRGLSFAALCAELLAAQWHAEPLPLSAKMADALATLRR